MSVMEGVILCVHLLILQQTVFPVTAQSVTLQTEGTFVEGSAATFNCLFTAAWNNGTLRQWIGPGALTIINNGAATNPAKNTEMVDSANNKFSMTIQNYGSGDEGSYRCVYGFDTSNPITLSISNTEVHPSSPPLDSVVIPDTTEAIALTISVPGIRPDASASFNLTSSTGTLKPAGTGSAVVTVTADGNGRTSSSSLKIDVPAGTTSTGDIFTITLVVGAYSETKQWTIAGPTTTTPTTTTTTPTTTTTTPTTTTTTPTTTTTTPTTTTPTTTTPTTTTTITPPNTTSRFTDEELGAVIGGTIGGICLLFILGLGVFYYYRVQNEESVIKDHKRKDRRDRGDRNKPLRGDNQQGPMEKEEVVVYHKGQAYLVDSKYQKDSKMRSHGYNNKGFYHEPHTSETRHHNSTGRTRSHGYNNNGYYHEPHTRETRHHNSMGRTRSNGHFISPQSYTGHRSDRHYGSSQIYKGQRSDPQIYHPSQPYNGGNIYPQYERYPGLGRGDDRHMYY